MQFVHCHRTVVPPNMASTNDPTKDTDADAAALLLSACARDAPKATTLPPAPHGRHGVAPGSPAETLLLLARSAILGQAIDSGAFLPLLLARLHQIDQTARILQSPAADGDASSPPFSPSAPPIRTTSPSFSEAGSRRSRVSSVETVSPGRSGADLPAFMVSGASSPSATIDGGGEISVSSLLNASLPPAPAPQHITDPLSLLSPAAPAAGKAPHAARPHPAPAPRYWSEEEHARFLDGLTMFGNNDYMAIAHFVGTRTPLQVRSHSQKFFKKVQAWSGEGLPSMSRKKNH